MRHRHMHSANTSHGRMSRRRYLFLLLLLLLLLQGIKDADVDAIPIEPASCSVATRIILLRLLWLPNSKSMNFLIMCFASQITITPSVQPSIPYTLFMGSGRGETAVQSLFPPSRAWTPGLDSSYGDKYGLGRETKSCNPIPQVPIFCLYIIPTKPKPY